MQDIIICRFCGQTIGPHWHVFEHVTCNPETVLQQEAQRLYRKFEERSVNIRLRGTGLRVTLAEEP